MMRMNEATDIIICQDRSNLWLFMYNVIIKVAYILKALMVVTVMSKYTKIEKKSFRTGIISKMKVIKKLRFMYYFSHFLKIMQCNKYGFFVLSMDVFMSITD